MSKKVRNRFCTATGLVIAVASFTGLETNHEHGVERATAETITTYLERDRQGLEVSLTEDMTVVTDAIGVARSQYLERGADCLGIIDGTILSPSDEEVLGLDCSLSGIQVEFARRNFERRRSELARLSTLLDDVSSTETIEALRAIEEDGEHAGFADILDIDGPMTETQRIIRATPNGYTFRSVGPYENSFPLLVINGLLGMLAVGLYASAASITLQENNRYQVLRCRMLERQMRLALRARSQIRRIVPGEAIAQDVKEFKDFLDYVEPSDFESYTPQVDPATDPTEEND